MNDIVRAAGGSLATLYAQFNSKEGLFLAIAEEQHEKMVEAMAPPCVAHLSLEEGLQAIGERFLSALMSRENLAFYRIVIGEGRKFPQLLQRYVFTGADRIRKVVATHLERAGPDIKDADQIASYFLELVRARHHYRALADESYALHQGALSEHVSRSVRFFLGGARAL